MGIFGNLIKGAASGGATGGPWGAVTGAGLGILGGFLGRKAVQRPRTPAPDPRMVQWDARVANLGQVGQAADEEYRKRILSFDPMAAATAANQAQWATAVPVINRQVADLRGQQVGAGRLTTGYGQTDQDQLVTDAYNNLNQSMIARAMEAAQMQAANNQAIGSYANNANNMYFDATYGRAMTAEDQRRADEASRRGMYGDFAGAALGAAGDVLSRYLPQRKPNSAYNGLSYAGSY